MSHWEVKAASLNEVRSTVQLLEGKFPWRETRHRGRIGTNAHELRLIEHMADVA